MLPFPSKILITGAAGLVGSHLRAAWASAETTLVTTDIVAPATLHPNEAFTAADLADEAAIMALAEGCEAVIHLGGLSREGAWPELLAANIAGTHAVFEAARRAGAGRIVYASSLHTTGFYGVDEVLTPDMPVRPSNLYGVTKCFGEALARNFHDAYGLECLTVRLGTFAPEIKPERRMLATWLSARDFTSMLERALTIEHLGFQLVYGMSNNAAAWWRNPSGMLGGWQPVDSADDAAAWLPEDPPESPTRRWQGAGFVAERIARNEDTE